MRQMPGKAKGKYFAQAVFLSLVIACAVAATEEQVVFTIVDRVQFTVPGEWPVISSKSGPEETVFAFQIPNPADKDTADSSNLVIVSSYLKDSQDREAFEKKATTPDRDAKEKTLVEGWRCRSFSAMQASTQYVDWDCYKVVAECGVFVRIAWPHLPKNPAKYDKRMEAVLSDFLTRVAPSNKFSNQN